MFSAFSPPASQSFYFTYLNLLAQRHTFLVYLYLRLNERCFLLLSANGFLFALAIEDQALGLI